MIEGVPDYHDSPTFQQLWDALGSKLIEAARGHLTFNQGVTGSRPVWPTSGTNLPLNDLVNLLKGHLIDKISPNRYRQVPASIISCQCEGLQLTTFSDALAAYRICAKAEGKSPKTVNWIGDAVRYFSQFLGDQANDLGSVNAQSLRQFILALQTKKTCAIMTYDIH